MNRPHIDDVMLAIAAVLSYRAQCGRRQVGCVLTDCHDRIVATGYNGRPRGIPNCTGSETCKTDCEGVHAEINALLMAPDADEVDTCYVTHAPCWHCVKALVNTGCRTIIFANAETVEERAKELWLKLGGEWIHKENLNELVH